MLQTKVNCSETWQSLLRPMEWCFAEAHKTVAARASDATFQEAVRQASAQATASYAPYSRCPAGLALITASQDVYAGPYVESAAYNPSLSPLQSAIVVGVIDSMPCYTHVSDFMPSLQAQPPIDATAQAAHHSVQAGSMTKQREGSMLLIASGPQRRGSCLIA